MKRNMDLIRFILLDAEGEEEVDLSSYTKEEIGYHCWLLYDAGLVIGDDITGMNDKHRQAFIIGINWDGHDFLDAARDDTTWNKAQETIKDKVGTVAFDLLKALLTALTKEQLGL